MMWSKVDTPPLQVELQTCTATMETDVVLSQEDANQLSQDRAVTLLVMQPKNPLSYQRNPCTNLLTPGPVIIFRTLKQLSYC